MFGINKKVETDPKKALENADKTLNKGVSGFLTKTFMGKDFTDKMNAGLAQANNAINMADASNNLAMTGVLLDDRAIIQGAEMHIVYDNASLEQRSKECDHGIHAFYATRERVMPGHCPANIRIKELTLDRSHVTFIEQFVHPKNQRCVIHY